MGENPLSWQVSKNHPWGDIIVWLPTQYGWGFSPDYQDNEARLEALLEAYAQYNRIQERGTDR